MSLRDILAIATSETASAHVLDCAEQLAEQGSGKVTPLVMHWTPSIPFSGDIWIADPWWSDMLADAQKRVEEEAIKITTRLGRNGLAAPSEVSLIEFGAARSVIGLRARHADITLVTRPDGASSSDSQNILNGALFDSGRPVLVVPPGWRKAEIGRKVLVAWKPTREAARALGDAEALLTPGSEIAVATVDTRPSEGGYGPHPGADIAAHLARKGYKPQLFNIGSAGRTETQALLEQALAIGADLMVMGGFGHARLSEFLFGGVTRDILTTANLPIFMSH